MNMFMNDNDFHEVGFVGHKFTWCSNKIGSARILERLDRCLLALQFTAIEHLLRVASDHYPIMMEVFKSIC
ncbi:hypothetical protein MA16_Dca018990 [Dendrobium catenatum]|uniref:Endonuclease/exonuclease/phosphatase domain-containing protein n=1 Tax=Dendrobium catenatum TaxID=906689 RepID=A0A2I0VLY0_9ASPA|nr:hypothetical protein MA16_Dca018990 [Dendrobium catenatum]